MSGVGRIGCGGAGKHAGKPNLAPDAGWLTAKRLETARKWLSAGSRRSTAAQRCAGLRCQQPALIGPHARPVMPDDRCGRFAHRQHRADSHRRNDLFEDHSMDFAVGSRTARRYRGHPERHDMLCFQREQIDCAMKRIHVPSMIPSAAYAERLMDACPAALRSKGRV